MDSAPPRHVWWRSHQKGTFSSDINECICNNYLWNVNLTVNNIDIWLWYWGMIFLTYYKIFIHYFLIYLIYFVPYVLFENFGREVHGNGNQVSSESIYDFLLGFSCLWGFRGLLGPLASFAEYFSTGKWFIYTFTRNC